VLNNRLFLLILKEVAIKIMQTIATLSFQWAMGIHSVNHIINHKDMVRVMETEIIQMEVSGCVNVKIHMMIMDAAT
jgi:hypothetical protein